MNPCPCGYANDPIVQCRCHPSAITQYINKISGPILDRIDIIIHIEKPKKEALFKPNSTSKDHNIQQDKIRTAIATTRQRQMKENGALNADLSSERIQAITPLCPKSQSLLEQALDKGTLTGRSFFKTLKVANTIACMEQTQVQTQHIAEALFYSKADFNSCL